MVQSKDNEVQRQFYIICKLTVLYAFTYREAIFYIVRLHVIRTVGSGSRYNIVCVKMSLHEV